MGTTTELCEVLASYLFQEYGRERGAMEAAAGRAPGLAREDYYDIDRLGRVGATREAQAGENLADQMARWEFAQQEPGRRTQAYISSISGGAGGTNSTTRTSGGGSDSMTQWCTWCETAYMPRGKGGSAQRFCSKDCRQNFNTACRVWAAAEYGASRVSIIALRTALEQRARCVESDSALERGKAPRREARPGAPPGTAALVMEKVL